MDLEAKKGRAINILDDPNSSESDRQAALRFAEHYKRIIYRQTASLPTEISEDYPAPPPPYTKRILEVGKSLLNPLSEAINPAPSEFIRLSPRIAGFMFMAQLGALVAIFEVPVRGAIRMTKKVLNKPSIST